MRPPHLISHDRPELDARSSRATSEERPVRGYECYGCGAEFEGEPAGSGLFVWLRGGEVRYEEPPLCEDCAEKATIGALMRWDEEEDEEG